MNNKERRSLIIKRAYELARSGKFPDHRAIETHLCFEEEMPDARGELDARILCDNLDAICESAQQGTPTDPGI
jgi:hypothetical protein